MAQTRLNQYIRESIVNALMDHKFGARIKENAEARKDFGRLAYGSLFTVDEHKLLASLPFGFFDTVEGVGGQVNGKWEYFSFGKSVRMTAQSRQINITGDSKMGAMFGAIEAEKLAIHEESEKAKAAAWAVVQKCTTVESLLKAWPEVAPSIPNKAKPVENLPVVQSAKLNEMFGLPADEKEAA